MWNILFQLCLHFLSLFGTICCAFCSIVVAISFSHLRDSIKCSSKDTLEPETFTYNASSNYALSAHHQFLNNGNHSDEKNRSPLSLSLSIRFFVFVPKFLHPIKKHRIAPPTFLLPWQNDLRMKKKSHTKYEMWKMRAQATQWQNKRKKNTINK